VRGAAIRPGDVIVADDDRGWCRPAGWIGFGARAAHAREAYEAGKRERLAAGELGIDLYGMREKLAARGLATVDAPEA